MREHKPAAAKRGTKREGPSREPLSRFVVPEREQHLAEKHTRADLLLARCLVVCWRDVRKRRCGTGEVTRANTDLCLRDGEGSVARILCAGDAQKLECRRPVAHRL